MQQYQDKDLTCVECGNTFTFSADEQELFAQRGYTNARKSNRDSFGSRGGGYQRQMYPAVCADCGKETEVPFEPRQGRPVYCRDCYASKRPRY